jgi:hypothetical protein
MSSNKKKQRRIYRFKQHRNAKSNFTDTIPLPKIRHAEKYFETFYKKCIFYRTTVSVKNVCLFITSENEEALSNVRIIIEEDIERFIDSSRPLMKILPQKKISSIADSRRKHEKLIPQSIIRTVRIRDEQHSKHVNQILRQKRQHPNNIKMIWKQWYINRLKFNAKFKAISQYFGQLYRQHHCEVSLYRQQKRSSIEYHKQKVLGRKRDRLKAEHAQRAKRKNKLRKTKNKRKMKIRNNTSKYETIRNEHKRTSSQISKLKFITVDSTETIMLRSKKKKKKCPSR